MKNNCTKCNNEITNYDNGIEIYDYKKSFGNNYKYQKEIYMKKMSKQVNRKYTEDDFLNDLSEKIGAKDNSTYFRWSKGKAIPKIPEIIKLSMMFGCSVDDLLKESTEKNKSEQVDKNDGTQVKGKKEKENKDEVLLHFLKEQKFSEKMINKIIELINALRRTTISQGSLFRNKSKTEIKISVPDFYTDLILNQEIEKPLEIFMDILDEFNKLSSEEIRVCKEALDINKEKYKSKYKDDYTLLLETLTKNLPQDKRKKINDLIYQLNIYIDTHKSAYILRLFNNVVKNSK